MQRVFRVLLMCAALALMAAPVLAATPSGAAQAQSVTQTVKACAHLKSYKYRVCTAYLYNASIAARLPYYRYVHSDKAARRRAATFRLESRYSGQALRRIMAPTRRWPGGENGVSTRLAVRSVSVNQRAGTARLVTVESWRVWSGSGKTLFRERGRRHTVAMKREQGLLLDKWVVTGIR